MALDWPRRRLWLLSDAKRTHSVALHWQGTVRQPVFSVQAPQPLQGQGSQKLDAEALVRLPRTAPERFWMASEARNPSKRPASLFELKLLGSGGFDGSGVVGVLAAGIELAELAAQLGG